MKVSAFVSLLGIISAGVAGLYQLQDATHSIPVRREEFAIYTDPFVETHFRTFYDRKGKPVIVYFVAHIKHKYLPSTNPYRRLYRPL
jgi:hypothetical protein